MQLLRIATAARVGVLLALLILATGPVSAAPGVRPARDDARHQTPDWLSESGAAALNVGIDVLVPSYVPAPFGGEPSISAASGAYRLYWFIPGTPPTFLQISGEAGGFIPDYSEYDRNNQLFVNANVQGYEAYHDLTPIYDRVYWRAGNVVYTVDSHNLTDTDSLSLANSLITLVPSGGDGTGDEPDAGSDTGVIPDDGPTPALNVPPSVQAGETAALGIDGVSGAMLTADAGFFLDSGADSLTDVGPSTVAWQAPETDTDLTATFVLLDPSNDDWLATGETLVVGHPAPAAEAEQAPPAVEAESTTAADAVEPAAPEAAPTGTVAPGKPADGTGAGLIGFKTSMEGDGTGIGDGAEEPEPAAGMQEQPGDLTGIGRDATQPAGSDQETEADDLDAGEPEPSPGPTDTPEPTATPPPTPTPGPSPTATLAPTSGPNGMVSRVIGPAGGELVSPAGATLTIPPGALQEDATVTIVPILDTHLPVVADVEFLPASAFDVSVATATGQSVEQLNQSATLRIAVPQEQWREGLQLYRIEGMEAVPLEDSALDEGAVSATTDHFSRFVAGLPIATEPDQRDPLPFIIGALAVLAVLLLIVGYVTAQQRRRPRAITPRSRRYR